MFGQGLSIGSSGQHGGLPERGRQGTLGFCRFSKTNHSLVQKRIQEIRGPKQEGGDSGVFPTHDVPEDVPPMIPQDLQHAIGMPTFLNLTKSNDRLDNALRLEAGPQREHAVIEALRGGAPVEECERDSEDSPSLKQLLTENSLLIKYVKGVDTQTISNTKKYLRSMSLKEKVSFRTDRNLKWSPQYFLNEQLTTLRGYLPAELLRAALADQLDEWKDDTEDESVGVPEESEDESENNSETEEGVEGEGVEERPEDVPVGEAGKPDGDSLEETTTISEAQETTVS